ncbi:MAG: hypothetical protein ABI051_09280 [Vicinamibacterales bacterium]
MAAQAPAPANPAKSQTFIYEMALRGAVELAGQKLAQQASVLVPEVTLTTEQAIVRGIKLDGYGFFFDVQAPNIQSAIIVWEMVKDNRRMPPSSQTVNNGRTAAAGGAVAPDPMYTAPAGFDADAAYTKYTREALLDALLDSSAVLPLGAEERLTIAASGIDEPNPNPLYRFSNSRKLVLTIKGADLQDWRQGKLTREQAKERIVEGRF